MVITTTLFVLLHNFFSNHGGDIASKMTASAGYDLLKKSLDFKGLTKNIKKYFNKDEEADKFLEEICNREISSDEKPEPVLRTIYEKVSGNQFSNEMINELKTWFESNSQNIDNSINVTFNNTSGFNIGVQNAQRDILNISGDYTVKNDGSKD